MLPVKASDPFAIIELRDLDRQPRFAEGGTSYGPLRACGNSGVLNHGRSVRDVPVVAVPFSARQLDLVDSASLT